MKIMAAPAVKQLKNVSPSNTIAKDKYTYNYMWVIHPNTKFLEKDQKIAFLGQFIGCVHAILMRLLSMWCKITTEIKSKS